MVRRTRRDLSDKRIRQIIQNRNKDKDKLPSGNPQHRSKSKLPTAVTYLLVLTAGLVIIYYLADSVSFSDLFSNPAAPQQPVAASNQPEIIQPPEQENETAAAASDSSEKEQPATQPMEQKTQIDVLNGCGAAGVAMKTTQYLRQHDLDVVYMGNYINFDLKQSMVIDWTGDQKPALRIAEIMGIDKSRVRTQIDKSKQLKASVIVGKDYKKLKPFIK